jgi:hypothetical protein
MLFRLVIGVLTVLVIGVLFVFTPSTPQHSTSSPASVAEEPVQRGLKTE